MKIRLLGKKRQEKRTSQLERLTASGDSDKVIRQAVLLSRKIDVACPLKQVISSLSFIYPKVQMTDSLTLSLRSSCIFPDVYHGYTISSVCTELNVPAGKPACWFRKDGQRITMILGNNFKRGKNSLFISIWAHISFLF